MTSQGTERVDVAVVGAGFSGLAMAARLKDHGYDDMIVLERGDDVGGVWRDNTYPGCAVDVPSHLYSLSFAPSTTWSRHFCGQAEILEYLRWVADDLGLRPHVRLRTEVTGARWRPDSATWVLDTSRGPVEARVLIAATGPITQPAVPAIDGLDTFGGEAFHTARWRHDVDLTGRRVAVVGTGASAAQVIPAIADQVAHLSVFQRTPAWVLPRTNPRFPEAMKAAVARVPGLRRLLRLGIYTAREALATGFLYPPVMSVFEQVALANLRRGVSDPALRRALTPDYTLGCKRLLLSDDYYPTLARPDVTLVTAGIERVTRDAIRTVDGMEHPVDVIVLGTGFRVADVPVARMIRDGAGRTLTEAWGGHVASYRGTSVAGFPNLALLLGPNTAIGHTSIIFQLERQVEHVIRMLRRMDETGVRAVEPTPDAVAAYQDGIDRRMPGTVWKSGCRAWYDDEHGRNTTIWPGYTLEYWAMMRRFDVSAYRVVA